MSAQSWVRKCAKSMTEVPAVVLSVKLVMVLSCFVFLLRSRDSDWRAKKGTTGVIGDGDLQFCWAEEGNRRKRAEREEGN